MNKLMYFIFLMGINIIQFSFSMEMKKKIKKNCGYFLPQKKEFIVYQRFLQYISFTYFKDPMHPDTVLINKDLIKKYISECCNYNYTEKTKINYFSLIVRGLAYITEKNVGGNNINITLSKSDFNITLSRSDLKTSFKIITQNIGEVKAKKKKTSLGDKKIFLSFLAHICKDFNKNNEPLKINKNLVKEYVKRTQNDASIYRQKILTTIINTNLKYYFPEKIPSIKYENISFNKLEIEECYKSICENDAYKIFDEHIFFRKNDYYYITSLSLSFLLKKALNNNETTVKICEKNIKEVLSEVYGQSARVCNTLYNDTIILFFEHAKKNGIFDNFKDSEVFLELKPKEIEDYLQSEECLKYKEKFDPFKLYIFDQYIKGENNFNKIEKKSSNKRKKKDTKEEEEEESNISKKKILKTKKLKR